MAAHVVRPTPEEAAASLGFDLGRAYAIRAIPPQGKTQEALERQMADDEQVVGFLHLRGLFRQHWHKGYHSWHVYLLAKEFLERSYPDRLIIHVRTHQQGHAEHDPWVGEYRCVDPFSGDEFTATVDVQWVAESDGIPVNWWMITAQAGISAESHPSRDEGGPTP